MKLLKQDYQLIGETPYEYDSVISHLEYAGRTCYKSYDKIIDGSGEIFITNIIKRKHLSVIEHTNFVLVSKTKVTFPQELRNRAYIEIDYKFIKVIIDHGRVFIGGNYRAFMERFNIPTIHGLLHNWDEYIPKLASLFRVADFNEIPTSLKRVSAKFRTDRAVLAEFSRHRDDIVFSVESQRYCSYLNELLLIIPHHYLDKYDMFINDSLPYHCNERVWFDHMKSVEKTYQFLKSEINVNDKFGDGYYSEKSEEVRSVLPNSTCVEMFVTAGIPEWNLIFNLRLHPTAYKQFRILMSPMKDDFQSKGWINGI